MDKETEIKHLRALQQGDTYFAQFFKNDVDQMVQNINNDFPIELGCRFAKKADTLQSTVNKLRNEVEQFKFDVAVIIFKEMEDNVPVPLQQWIMDNLGSPLRVIEAKVAANLPPSKEEVEYLIEQAKRN